MTLTEIMNEGRNWPLSDTGAVMLFSTLDAIQRVGGPKFGPIDPRHGLERIACAMMLSGQPVIVAEIAA